MVLYGIATNNFPLYQIFLNQWKNSISPIRKSFNGITSIYQVLRYLFSLIKEATSSALYFSNKPFRTKLNICLENNIRCKHHMRNKNMNHLIYSDSNNTIAFNIEWLYRRVQNIIFETSIALSKTESTGADWFLKETTTKILFYEILIFGSIYKMNFRYDRFE